MTMSDSEGGLGKTLPTNTKPQPPKLMEDKQLSVKPLACGTALELTPNPPQLPLFPLQN